MLELFDDAEIPIPCKSCDHEFAKLVGDLKREPRFTCPYCGQQFDAEELVRDLEEELPEIIRDLLMDL